MFMSHLENENKSVGLRVMLEQIQKSAANLDKKRLKYLREKEAWRFHVEGQVGTAH